MTPEEWQKARLIGENDDDEMIDSADDEEVDSDAAFGESDEDRYAGFFSRKAKQKGKQIVRFTDVNLDEDEAIAVPENADDGEEEAEGDPDEFIDLLDVLDGKGEVDMSSDHNKPSVPFMRRTSSDEDEGEGESSGGTEEEFGEEEADTFAPSDDEGISGASEEFQSFISNLDPTTKKRKAEETTDEVVKNSQSRKRRLITERTEAGPENEFHAHISGSKLQLDDLLAPLFTQSSNLLSLRKNTKVLSAASTKVKILSAPLPQRTRERLDREAAYEKTKEEVDKWSATMKRIREAGHLSFPLQSRPSGRVSNLELTAKFKPSTKLESSIDNLLKSAKIRDQDIEQTEDILLQANGNLTIEQVAERRAELRRMRELMFRAELKAKRINKIKSKTYRKIKRKEKERLKEKILEADGESNSEGERLKKEVDRARERATLRHKHTGNWARQMKQKHLNEGGRQEIGDMLQRGEQLRRKIQGVGSGESEEESSEEDVESGIDIEDGILRLKKAAFEELKQLDDRADGADPPRRKGVFEMKFMKDAMTGQQAVSNKVVDDFIKELGGDLEERSDEERDQEESQGGDSVNGTLTKRTGGRMIYQPGILQGPSQKNPRGIGSLASDTSSVTLKSMDLVSPPASPQQIFKPPSGLSNSMFVSGQQGGEEEGNPWLIRDVGAPTQSRKKTEVFGKDSGGAEKSKNKLKKLARKREEEREKAREDAAVEITMDHNLLLGETSQVVTARPPAPSSESAVRLAAVGGVVLNNDGEGDSDANSEVDTQEIMFKARGRANPIGMEAFQQRDLVARAFAGDNVVREFEEVKMRETAADAPKDIDTTIPGWGSWGGQGTKHAPPRPERIKKIAGVDPKSRADYNKKHVIISERRDKKAAKYLVTDLPYPYTSRAQYERSMDQPLGKEWNTRIGFQRGTLPRVVKKPGIIIDPLEKMT